MSTFALPVFRAFFLVNAVVATLCATIWFARVQRLVGRLRRRSPATDDHTAAIVRSERLQRAWFILWATTFILGWWWLGTRTGGSVWAAFMAGSRQSRIGSAQLPDVNAASYRARVLAARAAVAMSMAAFFAYSIYGAYLDIKLRSFALGVPPRRERWNPAYYASGAEELLGRNRRWAKWNSAVWIGAVIVANGLYFIIHP